MQIDLPKPGSYVLAVSGGVDSMVLLDLLASQTADNKSYKLVIAHLDHGIRLDSELDRRLVQNRAVALGLPFVHERAELGPGASEALARKVRYRFLNDVKDASGARAIVTAHHQDDLIETAIINLIRGSGRKGLSSLGNRPGFYRPLLTYPKADLVAYAKDQGLVWREDSTNQNLNYLRNYVRQRVVPRFNPRARAELVDILSRSATLNQELDALLVKQLGKQDPSGAIERLWFNHLPHNVAREVLATWLRQNNINNFDKKTLERLVVAAKVSLPGRSYPIQLGHSLVINNNYLALSIAER